MFTGTDLLPLLNLLLKAVQDQIRYHDINIIGVFARDETAEVFK